MNYTQKAVYGTCIPAEELPARAGIRVERLSDPDYGLSEDEIADRNEFIRCYLVREFELLMMLPGNEEGTDFFIPGNVNRNLTICDNRILTTLSAV
jgi:hypothetical protein